MRLLKSLRPLLLCFSLLSAAVAFADSGSSALPHAVVDLPVSLLELGRQAEESAPRVLTAKRELEHAHSAFRATTAQLQGSSITLDAPIEVGEKGVGSGVRLSWKQAVGSAQTTASVGLAAGYKWDESLRVAPTLGLSLTLPLTGDADVRARNNALELGRAQARYRTTVSTWKLAVIEAYRNVHLAMHDRTIADLKLTAARIELEGVQTRGAEGGVSAAMVHSARQGLAQAETALAAAELQVEQALFNLRQLTGSAQIAAPAHSEPLASRHADLAPQSDTAEAWIQLALTARDDVRLAGEAVELARAELALARAQAGLTGQLSGGLTVPSSSSDPESFGWYVGAAFTMPLQDATTAERVKQAEIHYDQALADYQSLQDKVRGDVQFAYLQLALADAAYGQAIQGAQYAAELLETAMQAEESGVGTQLAVANARVAVADADRRVVAAYYDVVIRRITLWHMVGGDFSW